ncbi:hypothetical protein FRB90_011898 [Tulasnella sp. 427]|nr:hypothetical protein FRB90_011898 [Tulasnella sp. 427]
MSSTPPKTPPKTWRTLSTKMATPFRKLSFSERARSRSPSRQGTTDIARSDSPTPEQVSRSRVVSDAPPPVIDTITTKPAADKDAVDLDSPTGSAKGQPEAPPAGSKPAEVDLTLEEDKVGKEEKAAEYPTQGSLANDVAHHDEPTELHHEHPAGEEQHHEVGRQPAPQVSEQVKHVKFPEHPDDDAHADEVPLEEEFDLKNAPEPASARSEDSQDFHAMMGDPAEAWADEADGDVTVSSPPVDRRTVQLQLGRPIQIKAGAITPELSPKELVAEEHSIAGDNAGTTVIPIEQVEQSVPAPTALILDQGEETRRQSAGETTLDVQTESPTRAVQPHSAGVESTFAKPYTIAPVSALSNLSNAQVIADDDDHDGTFVVRSDNQLLARVSASRQKPYNLDIAQWTTYTLPTGETYYHHPEARIVTNVDIVLPSNLRKVCDHLDQTIQAHHHHHHHQANHVPVGRLIDDASPPNTAGLAKSEPESRGYRFSAARDDQVGTEIWLRTLPGEEGFAPMTLWVDHLGRTVAVNPPWEHFAKGDGFDDELDSTLRYWDFIQLHPAHTGLPAGSSEEAMEALSWCYTDWLLHPHADPRRQPFSIEECRELINLLKTLEGPLQTHISAKIHARLIKHRQALNRALESEAIEEAVFAQKGPKDPFGNFFVKIFVGLFCFGIPYKYVSPNDRQCPPSEADGLIQKGKKRPLSADSPVFAAALPLVAALLITSAVVFLALPEQENAAEFAALVSLFFSAASLGSSIINLERRSSEGAGDESSTHLHAKRRAHPFVQSLPLVFVSWSIIALVVGIYLYVFGVEALPGHRDGMMLNDILRWVIVGIGASLSVILLVSAWMTRRKA